MADRTSTPSPAQVRALQLLLEEIYRNEMEILRLKQSVQLLRLGVHPQQRLLESLVGWEFALKENWGCFRAA